MSVVTIKYAPIGPSKDSPTLDYAAANAALERLIRTKIADKTARFEVNLVPPLVLDVRLSSDIAKVPKLKGSLFELVGEAYEEFDPSDYALA